MEFDSDWLTLGRHRVRLRSTRGFPTESMRSVAEVVRLAIDNNMSARGWSRSPSSTNEATISLSARPWRKTAFVRRNWKRRLRWCSACCRSR